MNPFWAAFWTAVGGLAAFITVLVILLGHMFTFAKGQGARDEREQQAAREIAALKAKVEEHTGVNAANTTQLALLAASVETLKERLTEGMGAVAEQLKHLGEIIGPHKPAGPRSRRQGESD